MLDHVVQNLDVFVRDVHLTLEVGLVLFEVDVLLDVVVDVLVDVELLRQLLKKMDCCQRVVGEALQRKDLALQQQVRQVALDLVQLELQEFLLLE
jgi:hypothetical protein